MGNSNQILNGIRYALFFRIVFSIQNQDILLLNIQDLYGMGYLPETQIFPKGKNNNRYDLVGGHYER